MLKCPFCNFENEDGALFCEQCKSDLGSVAPAAAGDEVPMAAVVEESTPAVPMATPLEALPSRRTNSDGCRARSRRQWPQ